MGVIIPQHNDSLVNNITMIESYFMQNMNHFQYCELDTRTDPEHIFKINLPSFTYYWRISAHIQDSIYKGQPSPCPLLGVMQGHIQCDTYFISVNTNDIITIYLNASRLNTNCNNF